METENIGKRLGTGDTSGIFGDIISLHKRYNGKLFEVRCCS